MQSNHPELARACTVGLLPPSSQWFAEVPCGRTSLHNGSGRFDDTEPPRTTVLKREADLQGRFELVWGGSTTPNNLHQTSSNFSSV